MSARTIAGLLDDAAAARPAQPLLLDVDGNALTAGEVALLSLAATRWLHDQGVRPGMTVAWQLPSTVPAALLMLALARSAVNQAPIIHIYRSREVAQAIEVGDADVLVVDGSTAANAPAGMHVITVPDGFVGMLRGLHQTARPELAPANHDAAEPRWIYFTSGTTGSPKGVVHSDTTLLSAAKGFTEYLGLGSHPAETGTICFPIAHIGGMVYLSCALLAGYPLLMVPRFTPEQLPGLLAEHNVTVAGGGSAVYQMLVSAQLGSGAAEPLMPSLRMLIGGGAPCPPELHRRVRQHLGVPVVHAYGMTEAAMICVGRVDDTTEQQIQTSGSAIPGSQIRIVRYEPDGTRTVLPPDTEGQIELCGANMTRGYRDEQQWAAALTDDGWFRTGDRGLLRPDDHIVVTGRTKELIIRKGENIAPAEIESELLRHPRVDEVAVVGVADELRGELVCAVVRRSPRHRDPTLDELCIFLDERGLMKQKWPERLVIVDDFPMTGLGKVAKAELARQIAHHGPDRTGCPPR
ncbi:class I adenylate-forming enzyme family protein [Mycobacterium europaeum]|uniref:class I adenylate-forming enzyme family protein n=1 Tax=Mycobacterium europaeum TaxID=761804 RepID=UPI001B808108|nr:AMP-binding protein [Mycobacterium europaeum]